MVAGEKGKEERRRNGERARGQTEKRTNGERDKMVGRMRRKEVTSTKQTTYRSTYNGCIDILYGVRRQRGLYSA